MLLYRLNNLVSSGKYHVVDETAKISDSSQKKDPDISGFDKDLPLSDDEILQKLALTHDGQKLSEDEARRFIALIRDQNGNSNK